MADISELKIAFIGFGNMASAMADGWIKSGKVSAAHLGAASRRLDVLKAKTDARGMTAFETNEAAARWADVVVIAVKPYLVRDVVTPLKAILADKVVLSVAVNLLFDDYEALLAPGTHHLSTLPNTPVAVNEGISLFAESNFRLFQHEGVVSVPLEESPVLRIGFAYKKAGEYTPAMDCFLRFMANAQNTQQ